MVILVLILAPVWANGNGGSSDDADTSAVAELIGGDNISKNSSLALAQSLGDVDLGRAAQCVVTEQYGIIIWQRQNWEYDPWCIAGLLDEQGKHTEAAMMRCFHKPTAKLYGANCVAILTFTNPVKSKPVEAAVIMIEEDDDDAEREARYSTLAERLDAMDAARAANVRRYNRDQAELQREEVTRKVKAQGYLDRLPLPQQIEE